LLVDLFELLLACLPLHCQLENGWVLSIISGEHWF